MKLFANLFIFSNLRRVFGLALVLLMALGSVSVEAKVKKKPAASGSKKSAKATDEVPIPIGHGAEGITLPRQSDGRMQLKIQMGSAFRTDETHLTIEETQVETYDEAGNVELFIHMPTSVYDLSTQVIFSEKEATIRRSDFEITGAHLTFDTQTRLGTFAGPVRMLIFQPEDSIHPEPEEPDDE